MALSSKPTSSLLLVSSTNRSPPQRSRSSPSAHQSNSRLRILLMYPSGSRGRGGGRGAAAARRPGTPVARLGASSPTPSAWSDLSDSTLVEPSPPGPPRAAGWRRGRGAFPITRARTAPPTTRTDRLEAAGAFDAHQRLVFGTALETNFGRDFAISDVQTYSRGFTRESGTPGDLAHVLDYLQELGTSDRPRGIIRQIARREPSTPWLSVPVNDTFVRQYAASRLVHIGTDERGHQVFVSPTRTPSASPSPPSSRSSSRTRTPSPRPAAGAGGTGALTFTTRTGVQYRISFQ